MRLREPAMHPLRSLGSLWGGCSICCIWPLSCGGFWTRARSRRLPMRWYCSWNVFFHRLEWRCCCLESAASYVLPTRLSAKPFSTKWCRHERPRTQARQGAAIKREEHLLNRAGALLASALCLFAISDSLVWCAPQEQPTVVVSGTVEDENRLPVNA